MNAALAGAVLTAEEILTKSGEEIDATKRLIQGIEPANLKGAAYDLRMASNGIVLPTGEVIKPTEPEYRSPVLLEPGATIFVSTQERINMPLNLTGNMSIKGELAGKGILSLTGLIVDPGYHLGGSGDGRLHFRLANLGSGPVLLKPGTTKVASIQFLRLDRDVDRPPGGSFDDIWARTAELQEGLGFIEELRQLQQRTEDLESAAARQERMLNVVVIAALFVVLTTLLGVAIAGLLSLGNDSHIVDAANAVVPNSGDQQVFFAVALFGLAAIIAALLSPFRLGRRRRRTGPITVQATRAEALLDLRLGRARRLSGAAAALAFLATVATALASEDVVGWYVALGGTLIAIVCGLWKLWPHLWSPITRQDVDERVNAWEMRPE